MPIIGLLTSVFGLVGEGVKGFFGIKQSQLDNISKVVDTINQSNISAGEKEKAIAAVITAETSNGYWLSAVWRPLFMLFLCVIVCAYVLGYTTPNLLTPMPAGSLMSELFELLKIGVIGYMPLRTVDKMVDVISRHNMVSKILDKIGK